MAVGDGFKRRVDGEADASVGEPTESLSAKNSLTRLFVTSNGGEVENGSQGAELLVRSV